MNEEPTPGDVVEVTIRARFVSRDTAGCCYTLERGGEEFNIGAASGIKVIEPVSR